MCDRSRFSEQQLPQEGNINFTRQQARFADVAQLHSLEGHKDAQNVMDKSEEASLGWHGSSDETLRGLLQEVCKLDTRYYTNRNTLKNSIYAIYARSDQQQGFSNPISDQNYKDFLSKLAFSSSAEITFENKFLNFSNENIANQEKIGKIKMRISVNTHPDRILYVIEDIIEKQHIAELPYVYNVKVIGEPKWAEKLYDPIVIYYYDTPDSTNTNTLGQRLLNLYAGYVRPSHPAMMEPINCERTQGIAYADQSKGGSWGATRTNLVAEAVWALKSKGEEASLRTLLPEVERLFIANNINPKRPQWNLH